MLVLDLSLELLCDWDCLLVPEESIHDDMFLPDLLRIELLSFHEGIEHVLPRVSGGRRWLSLPLRRLRRRVLVCIALSYRLHSAQVFALTSWRILARCSHR